MHSFETSNTQIWILKCHFWRIFILTPLKFTIDPPIRIIYASQLELKLNLQDQNFIIPNTFNLTLQKNGYFMTTKYD